MTLVPPQPDYQFIQSSTPSNAKKSDWWLDTSTSPPRSKVYDGSSFVRPEEVEFVDSRVSDAGATQSDIQSAILSDGTTFDGANIDAPISDAVGGASQDTIADGVARNTSKWQTLVDSSLAYSQPDNVVVEGSGGGVPEFTKYGAKFQANSGDHGTITSETTEFRYERGTLLISVVHKPDFGSYPVGDDVAVGWGQLNSDWPNSNDQGFIYLSKGGSGTLDVEVNDGGSVTTDTVPKPDGDKINRFTVVMDADGNFLNSETAGFYVNKDPRKGDSPDATISYSEQYPPDRGMGIFFLTGDGSQYFLEMEVSHLL